MKHINIFFLLLLPFIGFTQKGKYIAINADTTIELAFQHGIYTEKIKIEHDTLNIDVFKFNNQYWTMNLNVETSGSWCYDNDSNNCNKYGRLYTWYAANNVCKNIGPGWILPLREDWKTLANYYGGYATSGGDEIGNPKKSAIALVLGGSSDFDAPLAGWMNTKEDKFLQMKYSGNFWTSDVNQSFPQTVYSIFLEPQSGTVVQAELIDDTAASVRCLLTIADSIKNQNSLHWSENLNIELADSWCWGDNPANCEEYGRLYTFDAAVAACDSLGEGWRLPSDKEWQDLAMFAGGYWNSVTKELFGDDEQGAGALLYAIDGIKLRKGGFRFDNGEFKVLEKGARYWTSNLLTANHAIAFAIYSSGGLSRVKVSTKSGNSCLCVKN